MGPGHHHFGHPLRTTISSYCRAYLPDCLNSSCTGPLPFHNTPFQWLDSNNDWNPFSFFLKLKSLWDLYLLISALAYGMTDKTSFFPLLHVSSSSMFIKLSRLFFSRLIHTSPLDSSTVLGITRFSLGNVEIKNGALINFLSLWNKNSQTSKFIIQSHRFDFQFSDWTILIFQIPTQDGTLLTQCRFLILKNV